MEREAEEEEEEKKKGERKNTRQPFSEYFFLQCLPYTYVYTYV